MACRCFWDADTDNYAQDIYMNVSPQDFICLLVMNGLCFYHRTLYFVWQLPMGCIIIDLRSLIYVD